MQTESKHTLFKQTTKGKNIVILKSDKGNSLVVLDTEKYFLFGHQFSMEITLLKAKMKMNKSLINCICI